MDLRDYPYDHRYKFKRELGGWLLPNSMTKVIRKSDPNRIPRAV